MSCDATKIVRPKFKIFVGESLKNIGDAPADENYFPIEISVLQSPQNIFLPRKKNILAQAEDCRVMLKVFQLFDE